MSPEQLNRELTELVTRARRLLTQVEADLSRMRDEEPEAPVVPFNPPLCARQQASFAEAG
jgi:hypothetical protein